MAYKYYEFFLLKYIVILEDFPQWGNEKNVLIMEYIIIW